MPAIGRVLGVDRTVRRKLTGRGRAALVVRTWNTYRSSVATSWVTVVGELMSQRAAFDRALSALDWTLLESRRVTVHEGGMCERTRAPAGFVYVTSGRAKLNVEDGDAFSVNAGDLVYFSRVHHRLLRAETAVSLIDVALVASVDGRAVIDSLPDSLVLQQFSSHEPTVVGLIDDMKCGWAATGPTRIGDAVICSRIGTMVASVAIRRWFELGCAASTWLRQVEDPHISRALDELHRELGRSWSVDDLARAAAMSRSAFAVRFRDVLGQSPGAYLAAARMDAAKEMLVRRETTVTEIAHRLGYGSDAGFSRAFRRHVGASPALWRSRQQPSVGRPV